MSASASVMAVFAVRGKRIMQNGRGPSFKYNIV